MYHPFDGEPEFLELANVLPAAIDVSGASFSDGIEYTFPAGASIPAGGRLVLTSDIMAFAERYPAAQAYGVFARNLANEGERVRLVDAAGEPLADVTYRDDGLWPIGADGFGQSLVLVDPADTDPWHPESWRGSERLGGAPSQPEAILPARTVVVSEVLPEPGPPFVDAIEIENVTGQPIDVSGWYLSDDREDAASLAKFRIPDGTVLAPGGRAAFYRDELRGGALPVQPSGLGGAIYLSEPATGYVSAVEYPALRASESYGRVATTAGAQLGVLSAPTFGVDDPADEADFQTGEGGPNARPKVPPVVVSEIFPEPPAGGQEFVEIQNRSSSPVSLYSHGEAEGTWSLGGGISYELPQGVTLHPGQLLLVAGEDPERLRAEANVPPGTIVVGPFEGRLSSASDEVTLLSPAPPRAGAPAGTLNRRVEDRALYRSIPPWPIRAEGAERSLERVAPTSFGAEPRAWVSLVRGGTPGRASSQVWTLAVPFVSAGRR
jgi:hypothetical protein